MTGRRSPSDGTDASRLSNARGQSEVLGVVLLLAITMAGTGLILGFGDAALSDTQSSAELQEAELAMTVFDSRAATVALGDSDVQTVDFGGTSGDVTVNQGSGQITIKHVDWDGSGSEEIIHQSSLGALHYENDGTELVYQAGGVWRKDDNGGVSMVSPPEIHYRGATLTLPLVRMTGSGGASGGSKVTVKSVGEPKPVYPDSSKHYDGDSTNPKYVNPADNGQVEIIVESEYYEGWADYFRQRTNANVVVDHADEKVTVELISTGETGFFDMPGENSAVDVRGVGGHGMTDFTVTVRPDDSDSANFNNLQWSMYVDEGPTEFEIHVRKSGGSGCNVEASATVYYSTDGGNTYHGWHDDSAFESECGDFDGDGDQEIRMVLDFVDDDPTESGGVHDVEAGDPTLTYTGLSSSDTLEFNPSGSTLASQATFDGHGVYWESETYDAGAGDEESIDRLLNHYFSEMGGFDLTVADKGGNTVNEGASYGTIDYGGGGKYVTYLHITENEVEVEVEAN